MDSHSGIPVAGVIIPYSQSVNPRDVIAGAFAKRGFVVLPSLDERFRTQTLMVSYGESGRRNVALGLGYTIEITIQRPLRKAISSQLTPSCLENRDL